MKLVFGAIKKSSTYQLKDFHINLISDTSVKIHFLIAKSNLLFLYQFSLIIQYRLRINAIVNTNAYTYFIRSK